MIDTTYNAEYKVYQHSVWLCNAVPYAALNGSLIP